MAERDQQKAWEGPPWPCQYRTTGDQQHLLLVEQWCARDADEWWAPKADGGWSYLGGPAPLVGLVDDFVERLGTESFDELH